MDVRCTSFGEQYSVSRERRVVCTHDFHRRFVSLFGKSQNNNPSVWVIRTDDVPRYFVVICYDLNAQENVAMFGRFLTFPQCTYEMCTKNINIYYYPCFLIGVMNRF